MLSYCIIFFIVLNLNYLLNLIYPALIYIKLVCIIFCPMGIETAIQKNIWGGWSGVGVGEAGLNRKR